MPCGESWPLPRNSHLGAMVIVRREGFSNDQWLIEGSTCSTSNIARPGYFAADPSQHRPAERLPRPAPPARSTSRLPTLPRDDFDYVWLIDVAAVRPETGRGMQPVWRGPGSILYRLAPMTALSIVVPCFNEEACLAALARAADRGGAQRGRRGL